MPTLSALARDGSAAGRLRVLFVCTGNICRSPTAEGVLRHKVAQLGLGGQIEVDSAGTHDYHDGEPPDARAIEHAARRGYDLSPLRARQVQREDLESFDIVLAMDRGHLAQLTALAPPSHRPKLRLFAPLVPGSRRPDVPDPYVGGARDFESVLDTVEAGCDALIFELRVRLSRNEG